VNARIVNLRTRRKQKARETTKAEAGRRAAAHGRTRAERHLTDALNAVEKARLDGHALTPGDDE